MPTISVQISEEEKRRLIQHGGLSKSVREALKLYLNSDRPRELFARLDELQKKNPVRTATAKEVLLIREAKRFRRT